jgi:Bacterial regulatory helix-turn-helix protein, lysR family
MEMHHVRYFLAVAGELNFSRAAEKCNVSQPSLSRAIQLLEFGGGPTGVEVAGAIAELAKRALASAELDDRLLAADGGERAEVVIAEGLDAHTQARSRLCCARRTRCKILPVAVLGISASRMNESERGRL